MAFQIYRNAIIAAAHRELVPNMFREVKPAPRSITETDLKGMIKNAPSLHVAFLGATDIQRQTSGQMIGPWTVVFHVVAKTMARGGRSSDDVLLDKLGDFAAWVEGQNFGYAAAAPCWVTQIENMWNTETDSDGFAIGLVTIEQRVRFGRNRLEEEARALYQHGAPGRAPLPPIPAVPELV
jgi:hypothetical protein